ncbi:MAG: GPR endopeptidase [Oscillospiraceae bacterium]|nr:GPR endopeptidase [Oscillospiraceae bacterium]
MPFKARTDIASEAHSLWKQTEESGRELQGVKVRDENINGVNVCSVEIMDEQGSSVLGKSIGKYYTIELEKHFERGSDFFPAACSAISKMICRCFSTPYPGSFLIAALGNPDITPDALGPLAASNIIVTRHLKHSSPNDFAAFNETSLCRTGVLGTTGIESAVQIKNLCSLLNPDFVIAIDALAGADISRVCRTIQISSSGIAPGSGVGNNREELSQDFLGVPVIAIGMPTVIDATFLSDKKGLENMFVTPRGIDSSVRSAARLIAYGINLALHKGLSVADIDALVG